VVKTNDPCERRERFHIPGGGLAGVRLYAAIAPEDSRKLRPATGFAALIETTSGSRKCAFMVSIKYQG
jgi:hypothetical protein